MKSALPLLVLILVTILAPPAARGDRITLSNGRIIEGRVINRDENRVEIEASGIITRLSTASVLSIEEAREYENTLLSAETLLRRQDPVRGIDQLFLALKQGAPREAIARRIEEYNSGIAGGIEKADELKRPVIRRSLRALMDEDLLTTRTLFLTSQNFYHLQDWESASEALERVGPEALGADPSMRVWALEFMRLLIKRLLARSDFETALGYVERMRQISGGDSDPQLPLANLTRAAAARDRNDFERAFTIIAKDLAPQVPEIARNRAIYTIEQLKRWAIENRRYRDARESLAPIKRLFPVEASAAESHLIAREADYLLANGRHVDALILVENIPPRQRTAELDEIYRHAYHLVTIEKLGDSEPLPLLNHGRWCLENGLYAEAIEIFNKTRENPNLRDISNELLVNTRRERDTKLLEEAQSYMKYGNVREVMDRTILILSNPDVGSRLAEEAQRLQELAKKSMGREAEARPYQAEVFFQQAERAYFTQNFDESLNLINMIVEQYSDTPAARRAATLLPDVIRALEISYLEGKTTELPKLPPRISLDRMQRSDRLGEEVNRLMESLQPAK